MFSAPRAAPLLTRLPHSPPQVRSNLVYSTGLSAAESMREGGSGTGAKPMHHAGSAARPFQPGLWRPAHAPMRNEAQWQQ